MLHFIIVNVGGVCSLFLGVSLLSIAELMYYVLVRPERIKEVIEEGNEGRENPAISVSASHQRKHSEMFYLVCEITD